MNAVRHGEYLFQFTRLGAFSSYLLRYESSLLAIDTTLAGSAPAILETARNIGLPITHILLTHAHGDHVGSLDALHATLPGAEVMISAREARFLRGERSLDASEQLGGAKLRGGYTTCTTVPTRLLQGGDTVGPLQVIAAPGHTPGHLAFLDSRDGTLIAGDAFQTQGGLAVSGDVRWGFPFPALATWHRPSALETARRLLALNPRRLAVGHSPVLEQPVEALKRTIASAERRFGRSS